MKNFFHSFTRLGGFLLFLILEVVCFVLIVQYNQKQKAIYFHTIGALSGSVNEGITSTTDYFSLGEKNDSLHNEIAKLREKLQLYESQKKMEELPDTAQQMLENAQFSFEYIPAKIISKNFLGVHNSLILDRGSKDGVEEHMGVIGDHGIIGVVTSVSSHHAQVMPILHRQSQISASIKRNGYFGSLVWPGGKDQTLMHLEAVPKHADVMVGDTIQTSGYSNIFPEGILIGKVIKQDMEREGNYHIIDVELLNDLSNIKFAYILKNGRREDLSKLEQD